MDGSLASRHPWLKLSLDTCFMERSAPPSDKMDLTVLICKDKCWFAQCIEYDIAAQASSLDDVLYRLMRSIMIQVALDVEHGREPLVDLPPAPQKYAAMANESRKVVTRVPRFRAPRKVSRAFRPRTKVVLCPA